MEYTGNEIDKEEESPTIVPIAQQEGPATEFKFFPTSAEVDDPVVPTSNSSYVRLRHASTRTWVTATDQIIDIHEKRPVMSKVVFTNNIFETFSVKSTKIIIFLFIPQLICKEHTKDTEVFQLIPVLPEEVRNLDFVNDVLVALEDFYKKLKQENVTSADRRWKEE